MGKKKGKKIMKKIILTIVALLSMNMANAGTGLAAPTTETKVYDMRVNYKKLSMYLGLDFDQMDAVEIIHKRFCDDMMVAANAEKDKQQELLKKAVIRDLCYMRAVLDQRQYRKYQQLLNVTLNNRGLIIKND
jgi:hypothetical protein